MSVGKQEACALLEVSTAGSNHSLSHLRNHGEILRLMVDEHPRYPLFQFDIERHCVLPGLSAILAARPPDWSDHRVLHWLMTPHMDLGRPPAEALSSDGDAVLAAFRRETEPPCHG